MNVCGRHYQSIRMLQDNIELGTKYKRQRRSKYEIYFLVEQRCKNGEN